MGSFKLSYTMGVWNKLVCECVTTQLHEEQSRNTLESNRGFHRCEISKPSCLFIKSVHLLIQMASLIFWVQHQALANYGGIIFSIILLILLGKEHNAGIIDLLVVYNYNVSKRFILIITMRVIFCATILWKDRCSVGMLLKSSPRKMVIRVLNTLCTEDVHILQLSYMQHAQQLHQVHTQRVSKVGFVGTLLSTY